MLTVTDRALDALQDALQANRTSDEQLIRIAEVDGRVALVLDKEHPGDDVIPHNENSLLAIADDTSGRLEGRTLDLVDDASGLQLVLRDPE